MGSLARHVREENANPSTWGTDAAQSPHEDDVTNLSASMHVEDTPPPDGQTDQFPSEDAAAPSTSEDAAAPSTSEDDATDASSILVHEERDATSAPEHPAPSMAGTDETTPHADAAADSSSHGNTHKKATIPSGVKEFHTEVFTSNILTLEISEDLDIKIIVTRSEDMHNKVKLQVKKIYKTNSH